MAGLAVVALSFVALVAAGCSDDGSDVSSPSSTSDAPSSSTTTATDTAPTSSEGCGTPPAVGAVAEVPHDVPLLLRLPDGTERTYRLGIPDGYDPATPAPLVVNLHGSGSNALEQSIYSDMAGRAGARGMITVTPDAIDGKWELGPTGADADFLDALVDQVAAGYCVDPGRIHLAGMSLGAWKSAITACTEPERYASIALVTVEVHPPGCAPTSVVAFHGTADRTVPYGEGSDPGITVSGPNALLPGARDNIRSWAESAGCDPEPAEEPIGTDVVHWTFGGCDDGVGVELYTVTGGGHTWPGASVTIGATTDTIDATDLALDWFEAHPQR